jgi:vitamin B12 transporter
MSSRKSILFFYLINIPILPCSFVIADSGDVLIFSGTRLPTALSEVGTSVSTITAQQIEQKGYRHTLDAVEGFAGVTVNQNGGFGGVGSVRIRGALSEQTLVLIDGVPVNDPTSPGGGFDFARIDTSNIAKIEVLKGNQSTLWGSDAIGGVVSITTKTATSPKTIKAFAEAGSFSTYRGGTEMSAANNLGSFRAAFSGLTSNGISKAESSDGNSERDGFNSKTFSGNGLIYLPAAAKITSSILYNDSKLEYDGWDAQTGVSDDNVATETEELSSHITLSLPLFKGRLENIFLTGYSDTERNYFDSGIKSYSYAGDRLVFRYQGTLNANDMNRIAFGAEHENTTSGSGENSIDSLFMLYEIKPIKDATVSAAVRVDDHSAFGSETTSRFSAVYQPSDEWKISGGWAEGFKAPTIFQLSYFYPFSSKISANSDLRPETSKSFDVGVEWIFLKSRGSIGATYFHQKTKDQIDYVDGWYENINKVKSEGVEVTGKYQLSSALNFEIDYSYIDAKKGNGDKQLSVPKNSGSARLLFAPSKEISAMITMRHNGLEKNTYGNVKSWTRVDLNGSYGLSQKLELYGTVENIFDEEYQQVYGYGTPGTSASIGLRLSM